MIYRATADELAEARRLVGRIGDEWVPHAFDAIEASARSHVAEWMVADHLGLPRREVFGYDGGTDLLCRGVSVEVKWNQYPSGDFYLEWWANGDQASGLRAMVGVLVTPPRSGAYDEFVLRGWLTRGDFAYRAHRLAWQREGMRVGPGVEQRHLRPPEDLRGHLGV